MNLVFNSTGPLLDHLDLEHINWISLSFDSFQTAGLARPYWRTFPCYRYGSFSFSLVRAFPTDGITSTRVESTKPKKKINKSRLVVGRDLWSFCLFLFFIGPAHRQKRLRRRHQQFQTAAAARPIAITITRWWKSGGGLLQQAFLRQLIKYKKTGKKMQRNMKRMSISHGGLVRPQRGTNQTAFFQDRLSMMTSSESWPTVDLVGFFFSWSFESSLTLIFVVSIK